MKIGMAPERASCEGAFAERANPGFDLVVIFRMGRRRPVAGDRRYREIAVILDRKSQLPEHAADAGRAQCIGPHQRAALRRADLEGDAEQGDARGS